MKGRGIVQSIFGRVGALRLCSRRADFRFLFVFLDGSCPPEERFGGQHGARRFAMFHLKRVYEEPSAEDGCRILVERLWSQQGASRRGPVAQGGGAQSGAA